MADPNIQLPSLPAAGSANLTDLLLARQGTIDRKLTTQQLKNLLLNNQSFDAATILALLLTVDGSGSNLDADRLDGQEGSFYRDASNLNAGTIPSARLSASDLLTLIKTVDGSGSGLDSDLLDGQSSSFYRNASNLNAGTVSQSRLPLATTSQTGIIEQATQSEVNAGSGGNLAVIASTLRNNVAYSLGDNGYIRFPSWLGGFTIQWGEATATGGFVDTFPIAFTNVFQAVAATTANDSSVSIVNLTNTTLTLGTVNGPNTSKTFRWIAVGVS